MSDEVVIKNDVLLKLCEHCSKDSDECILAFQSPCATYKDILHMSVTDLKPVVYGEWKEVYDEEDDPLFRHKFYCSACGDWQTYGKTEYCPNCGAEMFDYIPQPSDPLPIIDDVKVKGVYNVAEGTVTYYHHPPDFFG